MLAYQRLQTIIAHKIYADEMKLIAAVLKTSVELLCEEETTEPWKGEPEPSTYCVGIEEGELQQKLVDVADESGIDADFGLNTESKLHRAIKVMAKYKDDKEQWSVMSQELTAIADEQTGEKILPYPLARARGRKINIADFEDFFQKKPIIELHSGSNIAECIADKLLPSIDEVASNA